MREDLRALFDGLELVLGILKGSEVLGGLVALAVDLDHLGIAVGIDLRDDHDRRHQNQEHDDRDHRQRVFEEPAHAVLEEGRALAHLFMLRLFLFRRRLKLAEVDLHGEDLLFRQLVSIKFLHMRGCLLNQS